MHTHIHTRTHSSPLIDVFLSSEPTDAKPEYISPQKIPKKASSSSRTADNDKEPELMYAFFVKVVGLVVLYDLFPALLLLFLDFRSFILFSFKFIIISIRV